MEPSQIARIMGPTWGPPVGPKWAPCRPHEPCYQGWYQYIAMPSSFFSCYFRVDSAAAAISRQGTDYKRRHFFHRFPRYPLFHAGYCHSKLTTIYDGSSKCDDAWYASALVSIHSRMPPPPVQWGIGHIKLYPIDILLSSRQKCHHWKPR